MQAVVHPVMQGDVCSYNAAVLDDANGKLVNAARLAQLFHVAQSITYGTLLPTQSGNFNWAHTLAAVLALCLMYTPSAQTYRKCLTSQTSQSRTVAQHFCDWQEE